MGGLGGRAVASVAEDTRECRALHLWPHTPSYLAGCSIGAVPASLRCTCQAQANSASNIRLRQSIAHLRRGRCRLLLLFRLLVAHQSLIRAYVISLMPGAPDADDVIQNTSEILWKKRANFELGTNFKAWALTTARFQVMAQQQKMNAERRAPAEIRW